MLVTRVLNKCHRFPGFVYGAARFSGDEESILVPIRPRKGSRAKCSGCHRPAAAGYDQASKPRRFEFIPIWGILVFFVYSMRRVDCRQCGVMVEEVPWGLGKHSLTKAYMHFLGHWARKLSWKETAESFRTTWDKVHDSVEYLVSWGLAHRVLGAIGAIGVDEVQYAKGHKYLTLVYQIDAGRIRLLWIGKERTVETFEKFFQMIGPELSAKIEFVCSDMWKPYLKVIRDKCGQALHVLDRFHIVKKLQEAVDDVRAAEAKRMASDGYEPILKEDPLVPPQAPRESNRQTEGETPGLAALQPAKRAGLSAQRRLRSILGLCVSHLGWQVPRRLVPPDNAFPDRTPKKRGQDAALPPRAHSQLLQGQKAVFQRRCRGPQQQGESHDEKILRLPNF